MKYSIFTNTSSDGIIIYAEQVAPTQHQSHDAQTEGTSLEIVTACQRSALILERRAFELAIFFYSGAPFEVPRYIYL